MGQGQGRTAHAGKRGAETPPRGLRGGSRADGPAKKGTWSWNQLAQLRPGESPSGAPWGAATSTQQAAGRATAHPVPWRPVRRGPQPAGWGAGTAGPGLASSHLRSRDAASAGEGRALKSQQREPSRAGCGAQGSEDGPPGGEGRPGHLTPGPGSADGTRSGEAPGAAPGPAALTGVRGRGGRSGAACGGARRAPCRRSHCLQEALEPGKPSRAPEAAGRPEGPSGAFGGGDGTQGAPAQRGAWCGPTRANHQSSRDSPARLQPELAARRAHRKALPLTRNTIQLLSPRPREAPGAPPQPRVPTARELPVLPGGLSTTTLGGQGAGSPSQSPGPSPKEGNGI